MFAFVLSGNSNICVNLKQKNTNETTRTSYQLSIGGDKSAAGENLSQCVIKIVSVCVCVRTKHLCINMPQVLGEIHNFLGMFTVSEGYCRTADLSRMWSRMQTTTTTQISLLGEANIFCVFVFLSFFFFHFKWANDDDHRPHMHCVRSLLLFHTNFITCWFIAEICFMPVTYENAAIITVETVARHDLYWRARSHISCVRITCDRRGDKIGDNVGVAVAFNCIASRSFF